MVTMSAASPIAVVSGLIVHYGKRVAVDTLDLSLAAGEIVGLLGPNGAGKSTTLLAMAGAVTPSAGRITIAGHDLHAAPLAAKTHIGLADQPPSLYEFLTVAEHLEFVAEARGVALASIATTVATLIDELGLAIIAGRPCRELSFGMRQRVGLAAALLGDVRVVLLDESLGGLDPHATRRALAAISAAAARGAAVLMSTHQLDVAAQICTRVMVMDRGKIVADDTPGARWDGAYLTERYVQLIADTGVA